MASTHWDILVFNFCLVDLTAWLMYVIIDFYKNKIILNNTY